MDENRKKQLMQDLAAKMGHREAATIISGILELARADCCQVLGATLHNYVSRAQLERELEDYSAKEVQLQENINALRDQHHESIAEVSLRLQQMQKDFGPVIDQHSDGIAGLSTRMQKLEQSAVAVTP